MRKQTGKMVGRFPREKGGNDVKHINLRGALRAKEIEVSREIEILSFPQDGYARTKTYLYPLCVWNRDTRGTHNVAQENTVSFAVSIPLR